MALATLVFSVLFSLSAGTFFSFGFVRSKEVGSRYFFYHGLIFWIIALIALWIAPLSDSTALLFATAFLLLSLIYSLRATFPLYLAMTLMGVALLLRTPYPINTFLSALLLGYSMAAMLLGHWYLVIPKLPIEELKRICLIFALLLIIRTLYASIQLGLLLGGMEELALYRYFTTTQGIFLLMRLTWGLILPLILTVLVWNTVKIRSTQSATGILYVVVLFILTGEILSQYLALHDGIAL